MSNFKRKKDIVVDLKGHTYNQNSYQKALSYTNNISVILIHRTSYIDYAIADDFIVNRIMKLFFGKCLKLQIVTNLQMIKIFSKTKLLKKNIGLPEDKFIFVHLIVLIKYNQKCLSMDGHTKNKEDSAWL